MTSSLGIYFGPKLISIVETKGKKVINSIQIRRSLIAAAEIEEKVPEDVKIVALFKDELRRNKIEAKEATICLSGKDLIIRSFEIPYLPPNELPSAVNFEARKYIPFKMEDLVSDFQSERDRADRRNLILFVGIKKEALEKYASIFHQLNIKINSIEYSAFSVLRFLKLVGLGNRGITGVITADPKDEGEVNFMVLQDGFPLFSRDISLGSEAEELAKPEAAAGGAILEKLKSELRISLDYYHRKLPNKKIAKTFLISDEDYRLDLDSFMKELGLPSQFIEVTRYAKIIGQPSTFNLSFIKGYGSSLASAVKTALKINLLAAKEKVRLLKQAVAARGEELPLLAGLMVDMRAVMLGLLICAGVFLYGFYHRLPLQKELDEIIGMRPKVSTVNPQISYDELTGINSEYKKRVDMLGTLINKDIYLTELLGVINRLLPDSVWLVNFSFTKGERSAELTLRGVAYLDDAQKEIEQVHAFLSNLKSNPIFNKYFKDIVITSVDQGRTEGMTVTNFLITCKEYTNK